MREDNHGIAREVSRTARLLVGSHGQYCVSCSKRFVERDVVVTVQGKLCLDCADMRRAIIREAEEAEAASLKCPFTGDKRTQFEMWAQDDEFVKDMVVADLVKVTGLDSEAIEYLLFRIPDLQTRTVKGLQKFVDKLRLVYAQQYKEGWDNLEESGITRGLRVLRGQEIVPFVPASETSHGNSRHPLVPLPTSTGRSTALPRREGRIIRFIAHTNSTNCLLCKAKARKYITRTITKECLGFCSKHWDRCHTARCRKKPVYVTAGGNCYCHECSRGKTPGLAFTALEKEGYSVGIGVSDALVSN